jgi:hypothetical protein
VRVPQFYKSLLLHTLPKLELESPVKETEWKEEPSQWEILAAEESYCYLSPSLFYFCLDLVQYNSLSEPLQEVESTDFVVTEWWKRAVAEGALSQVQTIS